MRRRSDEGTLDPSLSDRRGSKELSPRLDALVEERAQFVRLHALVRSEVRAACRRAALSLDLVDDLAQEVWFKTCRMLSGGAEGGPRDLPAWLQGIARHTVIDYAREARRISSHEIPIASTEWFRNSREGQRDVLRWLRDRIAVDVDDPARCAMAHEATCVLAQIVSQMPQQQRDVLLSKVIEGETLAAIARRRGTTESQVRRAFAEAIEDLRRFMRWADSPPIEPGEGTPLNGQ